MPFYDHYRLTSDSIFVKTYEALNIHHHVSATAVPRSNIGLCSQHTSDQMSDSLVPLLSHLSSLSLYYAQKIWSQILHYHFIYGDYNKTHHFLSFICSFSGMAIFLFNTSCSLTLTLSVIYDNCCAFFVERITIFFMTISLRWIQVFVLCG